MDAWKDGQDGWMTACLYFCINGYLGVYVNEFIN